MLISELRCAISIFAQYLKEYYQRFSVSFGIFQNKDAIKIITIMYFSMEFGVHMDQNFSANIWRFYVVVLRNHNRSLNIAMCILLVSRKFITNFLDSDPAVIFRKRMKPQRSVLTQSKYFFMLLSSA